MKINIIILRIILFLFLAASLILMYINPFSTINKILLFSSMGFIAATFVRKKHKGDEVISKDKIYRIYVVIFALSGITSTFLIFFYNTLNNAGIIISSCISILFLFLTIIRYQKFRLSSKKQ